MTNAEILAGLVCGALVITAIILAARAVVRWIERRIESHEDRGNSPWR